MRRWTPDWKYVPLNWIVYVSMIYPGVWTAFIYFFVLYVVIYALFLFVCLFVCFYAPTTKSRGGGILIYPCPSVRPSGYRYMVCPAISSYSFEATALIFCRIFIHIMEVCMSRGFWFSSNILIMTGNWT